MELICFVCGWAYFLYLTERQLWKVFSGWMFPNLLMYHGRDNATVSFKASCGFDKLVSPVQIFFGSLVSFCWRYYPWAIYDNMWTLGEKKIQHCFKCVVVKDSFWLFFTSSGTVRQNFVFLSFWKMNIFPNSRGVVFPATNTMPRIFITVVQLLSCVWLFATLWTVALQAPLSMGFPRQEYWSRLPFSSPGDLIDAGI